MALLRWVKKNCLGLLGICLVAIFGLTACNAGGTLAPAATPDKIAAASQASQLAPGNVSANGVLVPARQVELSFGVGGFVKSVEVEVGQIVQAGQALAALDTTDLQYAVTQAELDVKSAQTRLDQLHAQAIPVPESVLAATTAITSAQVALAYAQAQAGQRANQDIIDRTAMNKARRALEDAQNEYDKVRNDPRTHDWAPSSPAARALAEVQDYYNVTLAQYNMHAADRSYQAAAAQAEAQLAQAKLALYQVQHPLEPGSLALAQLDVERAQGVLEAARADLVRATLQAPFDGVVSTVGISEGEWAAPGAVVVELLDVSGWRIETKNVGELQISHVRVGQPVLVRVNAFRDQTLQGHVVTISPVAVVQQGDTTYTLTIELEPTKLNLQPGMTAQIEIVTK